ncbi:Wzz/FepE/Etk N-terminal domain-containing protein [Vibrio chemaguriensis]|uniref:Wzz/FepE/Etk N-terminal domain-containing protein n=1 Tax=Vibrio TaxID=662 RepID=UPI00265A3D76|nr:MULTISPECIES: Wzz/FepE/Etk N-terminal domain-containing protein [Vibrio]MCR9629023.1 Wzz/FepE/Etk N-terminal domain-containing protein [Vibrio antiquarius]MCR9633804.1 Wzz/FepE/Etk N-terminal domain-containing protein [Vibrio antiquarius]MCR9849286.1 Wzz/FepE/Etk N-terminal domain-containing protein [Vibrio antiquarius]MCR9914022.1 Wzz/FepE/Etk N-terminal domain-containing protein [Vibrio antiquarius]MDV5054546.1 Wzz/FepE/Etk N-terminal domain-containing protein [Vibrio sp. T13N]
MHHQYTKKMNRENYSDRSLPCPTEADFARPKEIDLRELVINLWKGKFIILVVTVLFGVASIIYALSLPNIYKADTLLAPAETSSSGGLSKIAGQLGGLATLAGVSLGGSESSQTDLAIQVLTSRKFINNFISSHGLLVPLMAVKGWDMEKNTLILDNEVYDSESSTWIRQPDGMRGPIPTAQEAYEIFIKDIIKVSENKDSGLYTISISHNSPFIAQQWLLWLIDDLNNVMRERTIAETSKNLEYLNLQLEKTSVADMQSTFYKLIEEQTKSLMLAEVQEEFVFKMIDPPVIPEVKAEPKRALICILGTLLGGIFGVVIVLAKYGFRHTKIN